MSFGCLFVAGVIATDDLTAMNNRFDVVVLVSEWLFDNELSDDGSPYMTTVTFFVGATTNGRFDVDEEHKDKIVTRFVCGFWYSL